MNPKLRIALQVAMRTAVVLLVFTPIRLPLALLQASFAGLTSIFGMLSEGLDDVLSEWRRLMLSWQVITRDDAWGKYEEGREAVRQLKALRRLNLIEKP